MRQWIPVSSSPKGRLALRAVEQFGTRPFDQVTVGELANAADVTTGALYHHFQSKLGLYRFVRSDVEQRLLDRMAGAAAASARISDVLLVGFDYAIREQFAYLLGQTPPDTRTDPVVVFVAELLEAFSIEAEAGVVVAAWRAALLADADGADRIRTRTTLRRIIVGLDHLDLPERSGR